MKHLIIILTILCSSISISAIEFYVPEDHPSFNKIDSLFNIMKELTKEVYVLENKTITQPDIRDEPLSVKEQYFQFMLQKNLITNKSIVYYYEQVKELYTVKVEYFSFLQTALEGDIRAEAFLYTKSAKNDLSIVVDLIERYREDIVDTIEYEDIQKLEVVDIVVDSGIKEIDTSNPFDNYEITIETIER